MRFKPPESRTFPQPLTINWNPTCIVAFFDASDGFLLEKPERSFEISKVAVALTDLLLAENCVGGEREQRSLKVWAHAVHGSACRVLGKLGDAQRAFEAAYDEASSGVLPWAFGETKRRHAMLLLMSKDPKALELLEESIELLQGHNWALAAAICCRGVSQDLLKADCSAAIADFRFSLQLADPKGNPFERQTFASAIENIIRAQVRGSSSATAVRISIVAINETLRKLDKNAAWQRARLTWAQGLAEARLGSVRSADRRFERAKKAMKRLKRWPELAIVTLDQAQLLKNYGEHVKAESLTDETLALVGRECPEILAALESWRAADARQEQRFEIYLELLAHSSPV
jgi:tetratricopeptide (TPR) repeat protein